MRHDRWHRRFRWSALVSAVAVVMVGCSGGASEMATERIIDIGPLPAETAQSDPITVPEPPTTSTVPTTTVPPPTEADLLNANIPGEVLPGCELGERIQLVNGELSGVYVANGFPWDYGLGVGRRLDGSRMIALREVPLGDVNAIMIINSGCEYTGRFTTSSLLTCNYSRCEIAETLVIDEVPFTTFTIVTTQATDLVVDGDDVVVTIAVCSADAGCTNVFQRYTMGPTGVERLD